MQTEKPLVHMFRLTVYWHPVSIVVTQYFSADLIHLIRWYHSRTFHNTTEVLRRRLRTSKILGWFPSVLFFRNYLRLCCIVRYAPQNPYLVNSISTVQCIIRGSAFLQVVVLSRKQTSFHYQGFIALNTGPGEATLVLPHFPRECAVCPNPRCLPPLK